MHITREFQLISLRLHSKLRKCTFSKDFETLTLSLDLRSGTIWLVSLGSGLQDSNGFRILDKHRKYSE